MRHATAASQGKATDVERMAPVLEEELDGLVAKHPSIARARCSGLFGCLDLIGPDGNSPQRM